MGLAFLSMLSHFHADIRSWVLRSPARSVAQPTVWVCCRELACEQESAQALGDAADACLGEVVMTQNCECTLAGYSKIVKDTAPGGICFSLSELDSLQHSFCMVCQTRRRADFVVHVEVPENCAW